MKNHTKSKRGGGLLLVIAAIAALTALGLIVIKPKALDADSKRAAASTEATAALEAATKKQGAEAAASVVKIIEVNSTQPPSPRTEFVAKEGQVALAKLPAPDAQALIEAEQRKVAILSGQLDEARRLYGEANRHAEQLQTERDAALASRQAVDLKLETAAAERLGAQRQRNAIGALVIGLALLLVFVKFTHLGPGSVAQIIHDINTGSTTLEHSVDTELNSIGRWLTSRAVKLKQTVNHRK